MSSLIKGPLDGAAAVRELTGAKTCEAGQPVIDGPAVPWHRDQAVVVRTEPRINPAAFAQGVKIATEVCAAMTADVENDGDRGPRTFRDPLSVLDQAADAQRAAHVGALLSAVAGLHVDEVRVLAWIAWQLPGRKLRRKCEEATATGWCRTEDPNPIARNTPEDRARSAVLGAWRQVVALVLGAQSTAARDVAQRDRGDVLADEAARRAGGGS